MPYVLRQAQDERVRSMAVPAEALLEEPSDRVLRSFNEGGCEVWRQLLDAFSNHTIEFTISLQGLQTFFSSISN